MKPDMKKISAVILACSMGMAIQAQTVIDSLTSGDLSAYTSTLVLDNSTGGGNGVSFSSSASGLQTSFVGSTSTPEQALLLAPVASFSSTFAVGDRLTVDVAMPDGPQSGAYTADFGLAVSATATPPAAGSGNGYNSRTSFDWASVSVRPPQSSIRANSSISGTLTTASGIINSVPASSVSQLFIDWVSAYQFTLGYFDTSNVEHVSETINFNSGSAIGAAIGFYSDMRDQGGIASLGYFSNLTIQPVPEPSTMALCGLGAFGLLLAVRRKKQGVC